MHILVSCVAVVALFTVLVSGHGRLRDPPGRSSAWRYGFSTPTNYNDNALYCGGKSVQWGQYGGRCGICGDSYGGPRDHEAGGRYASGTIVKRYRPGQVIQVMVELTANHKGWFEFRLCANNNPRIKVTQTCLDRGLLPLANGDGSRFTVTSDMRMVTVSLRLPQDLTCSQCVLQWKYNTGNSWGTDQVTGRSCVGCGPQEQFYGCADVAIGTGSGTLPVNPNQGMRPGGHQPGVNPNSRPSHRPNNRGGSPPRRHGRPGSSGSNGQSGRRCRPTPQWQSNPGMDTWCRNNCAMGNCPSSHCICE